MASLLCRVEVLAEALGILPVSAAHLLAQMGVGMTAEGEYDTSSVFRLLSSSSVPAKRKRRFTSISAEEAEISRAMGNTFDTCWAWLTYKLQGYGVSVVCDERGKGGHREAILTFPGGKVIRAGLHAAYSTKANPAQVGFAIHGMTLHKLSWYVCMVPVWGRVYLMRKCELVLNPKNKDRCSVTLSYGRKSFLLENKIAELKKEVTDARDASTPSDLPANAALPGSLAAPD